MKKILFILTCAAIFAVSCKQHEEPTGGFVIYDEADYALNQVDLSKATDLTVEKKLSVGQTIVFVAENSDADYYAVYPGEKGNNYYNRNLPDTIPNDTNYVSMKKNGYPLTKSNNRFVFTYGGYSLPGEYTIVFVSRNVYEDGTIIKETIDSLKVTVEDLQTDLFGANASNYKFIVVKPKGSTYEYDGDATVTVTVPYGSNLADAQINLKAYNGVITFDESTSLTVNDLGLYSWKGSLSKTDPRIITVTSLNGVSKDYTVNVVETPATTDKDLLTYKVDSYVGTLSGSTYTVAVPAEISLVDVKPEFTVSENAKAFIGSTEQTSKETVVDLSSGATYKIVAQDNSEKNYTIAIDKQVSSITALSFNELNPLRVGTIDQVAKTIDVSFFNGTDLETLVPTFTLSNSFVKLYIGSTQIVSGETEIDLTSGTATLDLKVGSIIVATYTLTVQ